LVEHVECFDVRCYWEDTVGVCVEECLEFVEREVSRHVGIVQVDNRLECVSIRRCVGVANVHVHRNLCGAEFHVFVKVEHVEYFDVRCYWFDWPWDGTVVESVEECLEFFDTEVSRVVEIEQVHEDGRIVSSDLVVVMAPEELKLGGIEGHVSVGVVHVEYFDVNFYWFDWPWDDTVVESVEESLEFFDTEVIRVVEIVDFHEDGRVVSSDLVVVMAPVELKLGGIEGHVSVGVVHVEYFDVNFYWFDWPWDGTVVGGAVESLEFFDTEVIRVVEIVDFHEDGRVVSSSMRGREDLGVECVPPDLKLGGVEGHVSVSV